MTPGTALWATHAREPVLPRTAIAQPASEASAPRYPQAPHTMGRGWPIERHTAITVEMIPFCRLPNMVLPDMKLARATARRLKQILGRR